MGRKVMIVFEETGPKNEKGDTPFEVYLEGFTPGLEKIEIELWPAADFWARKSMDIVRQVLQQTGAFHSIIKRNGGS